MGSAAPGYYFPQLLFLFGENLACLISAPMFIVRSLWKRLSSLLCKGLKRQSCLSKKFGEAGLIVLIRMPENPCQQLRKGCRTVVVSFYSPGHSDSHFIKSPGSPLSNRSSGHSSSPASLHAFCMVLYGADTSKESRSKL